MRDRHVPARDRQVCGTTGTSTGHCARSRSSRCSCSPAAASPAAKARPTPRGGRVVIGLSKEPPIVNPWLAQGAMVITNILVDGLNDPLVTLDEEGRWQPILATEVPTLENGGVKKSQGGGMTVSFGLQP